MWGFQWLWNSKPAASGKLPVSFVCLVLLSSSILGMLKCHIFCGAFKKIVKNVFLKALKALLDSGNWFWDALEGGTPSRWLEHKMKRLGKKGMEKQGPAWEGLAVERKDPGLANRSSKCASRPPAESTSDKYKLAFANRLTCWMKVTPRLRVFWGLPQRMLSAESTGIIIHRRQFTKFKELGGPLKNSERRKRARMYSRAGTGWRLGKSRL